MTVGHCSCTSKRDGWTHDPGSGFWVCGSCRLPSQATLSATITEDPMEKAGGFVHLRVRSGFAPMQGAVRLPDLVRYAKDNGLKHICISDPKSMHGAYALQKAALAADLTPIFAIQSDGRIYVALNEVGLENLIAMSSQLETNFQTEPGKGEGILIILPEPETDEHLKTDRWLYSEVAVELLAGDEANWGRTADWAQENGVRVLPTVDVRYGTYEQRLDYLLLEAIRSKRLLNDVLMEGPPGDCLVPVDEMLDRYEEFPEAFEGMTWLLDREFPLLRARSDLWPEPDVPEGETVESWFRKSVYEGAEKRFPNPDADEADRISARLEYELDIICGKNYPGYFLVVADLIGWAKRQGIRVGPGRGSAAGSLVSYCLEITDTDPLRHGLLFERFLNPERESPPDIDIDFEQDRRSEVIEYAVQRWGADRTAQIGTLGTFKAKQSIKDAQRVLGLPYGLGERVSAAVPPPIVGRDCPLSACFDETHERYSDAELIRGLYDSEPEAQLVIDHALRLEGLVRQMGVHAAGLVISSKPLAATVPMMANDSQIITQLSYPDCEALGLLKIDFLGLRNLDVISKATDLIESATGQRINPLDLPLADQKTFELLQAGDTLGVFQLDSGPIRGLLRSMKPDSFDDVAAVLALYRPGPMAAGFHHAYAKRKNNLEKAEPIHPALQEALAPILGLTYDVLVYQDQTLEIARALAGYSLGAADELRRAMGKKKREVMRVERQKFHDGMVRNGYPEDAVQAIWDAVEGNADYQFVKSHAYSYGLISWWTAYLKANFPAHYMAAVLSTTDKKERTAIYLQECRRMGIKVLPPHVLHSGVDYTVEGDAIRVGLGSIDGLGDDTAGSIVAQRKETAPTSLLEWAATAPPPVVAKRPLEALLRAGALQGFGHSRKSLAASVTGWMSTAKAASLAGQVGLRLFPEGVEVAIPDVGEYSRPEVLALEKAAFGLYVSDHPLALLAQNVAELAENSIAELAALPDRERVRIAGMVTAVLRKTTKADGRPWGIVSLEDLDGDVEVLMFPKTWADVKGAIREGAVLAIEGRVSRRDGSVSVIPDTVSAMSTKPSPPVVLRLPARLATPEHAERLRQLSKKFPGDSQLQVALHERGKWRLFSFGRVNTCPEMLLALKTEFGPRSVRVG